MGLDNTEEYAAWIETHKAFRPAASPLYSAFISARQDQEEIARLRAENEAMREAIKAIRAAWPEETRTGWNFCRNKARSAWSLANKALSKQSKELVV